MNKKPLPPVITIISILLAYPTFAVGNFYNTEFKPYNEVQNKSRNKSRKRKRYIPEIVANIKAYRGMYKTLGRRDVFIEGVWILVKVFIWTIFIWVVFAFVVRQRSPPNERRKLQLKCNFDRILI